MMKNKTCLLIAAASILLAGCQETAVSSSSSLSEPDSSLSSSDPSSSSLPDSGEDVDAKKQAIVDFIDRAEEGTNYTYAFTDGSAFVSNPTIMTPEYISYPSEQMARVALPSYEGDGSKLLYDIDKAEGEYSIVVAATYTDTLTGEVSGYASTDELDYLALLKREDVAWGSEALFEQSGNYLSEDENVILIFASMFGLGNYTDYVMRVLFNLDGDSLYVGFIPNYTDSDGSISPAIEGTMGVIYDVGTSVDEEVAAFVSSYEMPTESLGEENLSYLKGDKVTYSADLTLYLDGIPDSYPAKATFSYDYAAQRAKIVDSSVGGPETSYYAANSDGTLVEQFLSPENRLVELGQGVSYEEWVPDLLDRVGHARLEVERLRRGLVEQARAAMTDLCQYVDVCISNEEDAKDVFGIEAENTDIYAGKLDKEGYKSVAKQLADRFNFEKVAITLRESKSASDNDWSGMLYDSASGEYCFSKLYHLHIIDRVGGGDSFGGGLIYALLNGKSTQEAIEFAVATSALKHSIEGDYNMVSVAEVEKLAGGDSSGRVQR